MVQRPVFSLTPVAKDRFYAKGAKIPKKLTAIAIGVSTLV
jgi:hypothetical protein